MATGGEYVPCVWGHEGFILQYERHVINSLDAPIQDRQRACSFRQRRPRDFPRFRNKPPIAQEIDLNLLEQFHSSGSWNDVSSHLEPEND